MRSPPLEQKPVAFRPFYLFQVSRDAGCSFPEPLLGFGKRMMRKLLAVIAIVELRSVLLGGSCGLAKYG